MASKSTREKNPLRWNRVYERDFDADSPFHPAITGETACRLGAWVDLVGMAEWCLGRDLERGELEISMTELAQRWNWREEDVIGFLRWLGSVGLVSFDQSDATHKLLATVINYSFYNGTAPKGKRARSTFAKKLRKEEGKEVRSKERQENFPAYLREAIPDKERT